jgi:hypothetical protein
MTMKPTLTVILRSVATKDLLCGKQLTTADPSLRSG